MQKNLLTKLFVIGFATIAIIVYFSYWQSKHMKKIANLYADNIKIQKFNQELELKINNLERSAKMSAFSGVENWENQFEEDFSKAEKLLLSFTTQFPEIKIDELRTALHAYHELTDIVFENIRLDKDLEARKLVDSIRFEIKKAEVDEKFGIVQAQINLKTENLWKEINSSYAPLKIFVVFLVLFITVLLSFGAYAIINWSNSLTKMNERLAHLVEEQTREIKEQSNQLLFSSKLATMGEISAGIGHEINNPLAAIMTTSSIVEKMISKPPVDEEKIKEQINRIKNMAEKISKIVKGLKTLSRNDSSEVKNNVSLISILDSVYVLCDHRFHYESVNFKKSTVPNIYLNCNDTQIMQVLVNIIGNAVDAVVQGNDPWVEICFEDLNDKFNIIVSNSGKKIPKEIQDKIFQSFYTTKEKGKGTGLGLPLSKKIMEAHGGTLVLDDTKEFTTFVAGFPRSSVTIS